MSPFPKTLKDYIDVAALRAYTKTVEAEYFMLKALHEHLGLSTTEHNPTKTSQKAKSSRTVRGNVKASVLAFLRKNQKGKAMEIAKLSGLKVASVQQTLDALKKSGHVKKDKKRGSPFELAKK